MNPAQRISDQRRRMLDVAPFYGVLALRLTIEEASAADVPTMATDGRRILYSAAFVETLTDPELRGVVAHEVMHCAMLHFAREHGREHSLWNAACDYAVNPILIKDGFILPASALNESRFIGHAAESIYATLRRENEDRGRQGKPAREFKPGCGDVRRPAPAQDVAGDPGDGTGSNPDLADAALADSWRIAAVTAASAESKRAGRMSAGAARVMGDAKQPARIDWRETLRRFVSSMATTRTSWSRPSRRSIARGFYMPGRIAAAVGKAALLIDTSGSHVGTREQGAAAAEAESLMAEGMVESLAVAYCDSKVVGSQFFEDCDPVNLVPVGGGGTAFAPAIKWTLNNHPDVACAIYITDLGGSDFGPTPPFPVLWLATSDHGAKPPFGETVRLHLT